MGEIKVQNFTPITMVILIIFASRGQSKESFGNFRKNGNPLLNKETT